MEPALEVVADKGEFLLLKSLLWWVISATLQPLACTLYPDCIDPSPGKLPWWNQVSNAVRYVSNGTARSRLVGAIPVNREDFIECVNS